MEKLEENFIFLEGRKRITEFKNTLVNTVSCGIIYSICRICPRIEIFLKTSPCSLDQANCVVLRDQYGGRQLIEICFEKVISTRNLQRYTKNTTVRILNSPYGRFIYDFKLDKFILPNFICERKTFEEIYENNLSITRDAEKLGYYEKKIIYGDNKTGIIVSSTLEILMQNIIEPFFIWEVFSIVIWILIRYYKYAVVAGLIYTFMLCVNIRDELRKNNSLRQSIVLSKVRVLREGVFKSISELEIFPGDLIYIDQTDNFSCDVEILRGTVITDESFLTGESVPICKGTGSIVYSGTKVIKSTGTPLSLNNPRLEKLVKVKSLTRSQSDKKVVQLTSNEKSDDYAIAIVIRTGKRTKRSTLLTNLSTRKPVINEFIKQSSQVTKYLILSAVTLMFSSLLYFFGDLTWAVNLQFSFDMALTFFSPALYTCLQLGIQRARRELLKKGINTTEVSRINTAGEVDLVVFDKTGTLTELGVDILCFDTIFNSYEKIDDLEINARMALSSCHYVIELDNQYSGDVIDMKMFLFSQSKIINKDNKRYIKMEAADNYKAICKEYTSEDTHPYIKGPERNVENEYSSMDVDCTLFFNAVSNTMYNNDNCPEDTLEVCKIYDFDMYLKRLSVIVKDHSGKTFIFCKGAPDSVEKILGAVPTLYAEKVRDYGLEGYRVLTVAWKEIEESKTRSEDESNLHFLGFLILANKLKDETIGVIKELRGANLNPKMCTGDNILTAISVSKECGMIDMTMPVLFPVLEEGCKSCYDVEWYSTADEDYIFDKFKMVLHTENDNETHHDFVIACEGKEFIFFKGTCYEKLILEKGVVFARFNPDNKKDLIEQYSKGGYVTMFCGDGANDTGALCSADVGLSLATNEASLAASFNSKHLYSVLDLVKEGRSALSMSSAQFKYILYSQILAGFQILALLPFNCFPSDGMSLVSDLMSCYILGYSLSSFDASKTISSMKLVPNVFKDAFEILKELILVLISFFGYNFIVVENKVVGAICLSSKKSTIIFFSTFFLLITKAFQMGDFGLYRSKRRDNYVFLFCIFITTALFLTTLIMHITSYQFAVEFFNFIEFNRHDMAVLFACLFTVVFLSFVPFKKISRFFL